MTLILDIPAAVEERLRQDAAREGLSVEEYALRRLTDNPDATPAASLDTGDYLLGLAEEFKASMPEAEWNRLPADYAANYMEYLLRPAA